MSTVKRKNIGFTIIELMVVITIIVLLVAILIPVISKARNSSRAAATLAQMTHIKQAIEHYHADFAAYPGPVDDDLIDGTATFSGAQNLYLGLTRRFYPAAPTGTGITVTKVTFGASSIWFDNNSDKQMANYSPLYGTLTVQSAIANPCSTFDPYMTPKPEETSTAAHSAKTSGLDLANLPCFVDAAFGGESKPILYYRQAYKWDAENATAIGGGANNTPYATKIVRDKFTSGKACYYANNNTLVDNSGTIPTDVANGSIPKLDAFVTTTVNGTAVPRSGFVLISAGVDRVYGTSDDIVVSGD